MGNIGKIVSGVGGIDQDIVLVEVRTETGSYYESAPIGSGQSQPIPINDDENDFDCGTVGQEFIPSSWFDRIKIPLPIGSSGSPLVVSLYDDHNRGVKYCESHVGKRTTDNCLHFAFDPIEGNGVTSFYWELKDLGEGGSSCQCKVGAVMYGNGFIEGSLQVPPIDFVSKVMYVHTEIEFKPVAVKGDMVEDATHEISSGSGTVKIQTGILEENIYDVARQGDTVNTAEATTGKILTGCWYALEDKAHI